jgi:hypothetical protein
MGIELERNNIVLTQPTASEKTARSIFELFSEFFLETNKNTMTLEQEKIITELLTEQE